jgi:cobalamin biosynthesis Co2+ chelatase CbiK
MEEEVAQGFDRNLDFNTMKKKLVKALNKEYIRYTKEERYYAGEKMVNKICYMIIALIQLRNGSRISEACKAFKKFLESRNVKEMVTVKIAKSDGLKYNNKTKQKDLHKARFRKMIYPKWVPKYITSMIMHSTHLDEWIKSDRQPKRVLDFLLKNFDCNTHSLRYACINYLLNDQKIPMPTVAKFVGHINVNQLVTYTQNKNVDKIFDMDI